MNPRLSKEQYISTRRELRALIKQRSTQGGPDMRHALLALGFIKGRSYRTIERWTHSHHRANGEKIENILLATGCSTLLLMPAERSAVRPIFEWLSEPELARPRAQVRFLWGKKHWTFSTVFRPAVDGLGARLPVPALLAATIALFALIAVAALGH